MAEALIITGPCGAGKTSVGFECLELLGEAGVPAAMVDAELAYFHPKPADDRWGYAVAERALAALWPVYRDYGIERLLLPRVVEDEEQLGIVERAVPDATLRVFRLVASLDTIDARLAEREVGTALEWHKNRAREIARSALGEPVEAERPVRETAREILERADWV